jgi:hypothetical protein
MRHRIVVPGKFGKRFVGAVKPYVIASFQRFDIFGRYRFDPWRNPGAAVFLNIGVYTAREGVQDTVDLDVFSILKYGFLSPE